MLLTCLIAAAVSAKPPAASGPDATEAAHAGQPAHTQPRLDAHTVDALAGYPGFAPNVWRVDGPADIRVERDDSSTPVHFRFDTRMLIDTKLPVGYPQPTPPDVIEIKAYPGVRRAQVSGQGNPDLGMNLAFWPLFQHIERNDIAMTAPVEIDYGAAALGTTPSLDPVARPDAWTMSFLYERQTDGPAGEFGRIDVVDRQPMLVLAVGLRGPYRYSRTQAALARLNEWLDANPAWEVAGHPRMLGYNGPDRRPADQWSEIQVPIRLAASEPESRETPDPDLDSASKGLLSATTGANPPS